ARNQILDRARNEHFVRLRQGSDAGRDMHGDAADIVLDELTLARVQSSANLQPERPYLLAHGARASYRPRRSVESGKQTIACSTHRVAPEHIQLPAQQRIKVAEQLAPPRVANFGGTSGRTDD